MFLFKLIFYCIMFSVVVRQVVRCVGVGGHFEAMRFISAFFELHGWWSLLATTLMSIILLFRIQLGPCYKSELDLKTNSSEILPVNCKFFCVHIVLFCTESQT